MDANDGATVLVDAGVGVLNPASSRTIFITSQAKVPDGDGPYISLTEYSGGVPMWIHNRRKPNFEFPSLQVRTRHPDPDVAKALALQAYYAFCEVVNQTINGTFYLQVVPRQRPFDDGLDNTGRRVQFVFNLMSMLHPS